MPQFTNINYNAIQLHSNNSSYNLNNNYNGSSNRNLNGNHSNGYYSHTNNNSYNFKISNHHHSNNSPSATLTPGRKSASPTFFHSNDSLYNRHINNLGNYYNPNHNGYGLSKHLNYGHNYLNYGHVEHTSLHLSHHEPTLKIPTTPTRSKSLSPSLRNVIQPPRLRHKQQNKTSRNNNDQTHNTSYANGASIRNNNEDKSKNNENFFFEPIVDNNLKLNNKSETSVKQNLNTQTNNSIRSIKEQTDNNNKYSKNLSNLENTKPSNLNEFDDKVIVKKPIPILPLSKQTNGKSESSTITVNKTSSNENQLLLKDNKSRLNDNINKNELGHVGSKEINCVKICEQNDNEIKIEKFKLPLNVRMINLNNFPPNQAPNAKRHYSASMQRIKSENLHNSDKCFNILKQSVQCIFNDEIKQVFDKFKQDFIDPAVKNFNQNKTESPISHKDMVFFIVNLLDEAKNSILGDDSELAKTTPTTTSSFSSDSLKRKLDNDLEDNTGSEISLDSVRKKVKNPIDQDQDSELGKKELKIDTTTKFVLGKNVNDVFCQIQQHFYEVNSEDSTSSTTNQNDSTNKSIYIKFPSLFRYEADQFDRQWLNENQIIKRKNIKCYLLLLDDINELFTNNFKLNNSNQFVLNETNNNLNVNDKKLNDTNLLNDDKNVILKKLKSFTLPEFIIYKLKKQYCFKKSKFM